MIAFEISIDGQKICTAGIGDGAGVLSAIATWARRASGDGIAGESSAAPFHEEMTLQVGGLHRDAGGAAVHVDWVDRALSVGQEITLKVVVVDADAVDPPRRRRREDPAWVAREKRRYYESLEREYGDA